MAASKRFVLNTGPGQAFESVELVQAIACAINGLPARPPRVAIALSAGADSAMLAVQAAAFARRQPIELHCFHIHHGLQEQAGRWQAHAHDLAHRLQIPCHSRRAQVDLSRGDGMESAAREARYEALKILARQTGVQHVLLAHHRNDQAETVLLRLLRGAGPAGLAAMAPVMQRGGLVYLRPFLDIDRAAIMSMARRFAQDTGWEPVSDPSNSDDQYTRAAVRERLVPALDERWPGWQGNLARHARLSAEAGGILAEVAAQDLAGLDPSPDALSFSLQAWRRLSPPRQSLVLRYWLAQSGLRMPSQARLDTITRQLRELHALGHDRQMRVKHGLHWVCCINGRVLLAPVDSGGMPVIQ
jgi:tRNA(Ile)-lysidine synthase